HFARECRSKGNQESRRRDAGNTRYKAKDNWRRPGKQEEPKALVTLDGEGVDWTGHAEDDQENFALMAYSNLGSDTEMGDKDKSRIGHACSSPPITGNYMPPGPDREVDDSMFIYGPKQSKTGESDTQTINFDSCESNSSVEILESMTELIVVKPKVVSQPKVWFDAPIINEYESDSDDEYVIQPLKEQEKPSFAFVNTVELNKRKGKGTGQGENKPVWNNVQRLNHQNKFIPKAVLTKTGIFPVNTARQNLFSQAAITSTTRKVNIARPIDNPQRALKNKGIVDSGCSRHMTGNKAYLVEYQDYNGGPVAFGGSKGYITGKGKIKTGKLDFEDVCFVNELQHFNLSSVSQMCDKKNKVLFTDIECLVLSPDFKLPDENQVLPKVPRQNNMYSFNLENIVPSGGLACLIAKTTVDESNKWHRRSKGIKREYSNARTPQQNEVAERKNKTLIEATRTMLADSFLPNTFWAEAVSTACYVLNRVLVTKPHNKTPYNWYSLNSKAFRVYNLETKRVEENLHITFLENKPNVAGKGPHWLFDLDYLTDSMNYLPVRSENQANKHTGPKEANHSIGIQDTIDAENSEMEAESAQDYFVLPIWSSYTSMVKSSEAKNKEAARASSTNTVNTASTPVSTASPSGELSFTHLTNTDQDDSKILDLEDSYDNPNDGIFTNASYDDEGAVADFTNLETLVNVSPIPTSRINAIHPSTQILGDLKLAVQTRSKVNKSSRAHAFVNYIQKPRRNNHKDFQHCLFACFLSQIEPKKISEALEDESWVDAMQEELL
ncbi:putative ribonuclease H-like domain-containing protein, partial [Tanacetum coccineum]